MVDACKGWQECFFFRIVRGGKSAKLEQGSHQSSSTNHLAISALQWSCLSCSSILLVLHINSRR
jgi:hypothetical protein